MTNHQLFKDESPEMRRRRLGKMEPGVPGSIAFFTSLWLFATFSPLLLFIGLLFGVGFINK